MRTLATILVVGGGFAILVANITYIYLIRVLRTSHPAILEQIDPHGFRAYNFPSQLRSSAHILTRRLFAVPDRRVKVPAWILTLCSWLVMAMLLIALFARQLVGSVAP